MPCLQLEDLKQFRQWGSKTPGHPENFETLGIEVTTGEEQHRLGLPTCLLLQKSRSRVCCHMASNCIHNIIFVIPSNAGRTCLQMFHGVWPL